MNKRTFVLLTVPLQTSPVHELVMVVLHVELGSANMG